MKWLVIIFIFIGLAPMKLFEPTKKAKTEATVKTVIECIYTGKTDKLANYNGAGDEFKDDLLALWNFYWKRWRKGEHTPFTEKINYNDPHAYERLIENFRHDQITESGHSPYKA